MDDLEVWSSWIGKKVVKAQRQPGKTPKKFKWGSYVGTPKAIVEHPVLRDKPSFAFEESDMVIVECDRCSLHDGTDWAQFAFNQTALNDERQKPPKTELGELVQYILDRKHSFDFKALINILIDAWSTKDGGEACPLGPTYTEITEMLIHAKQEELNFMRRTNWLNIFKSSKPLLYTDASYCEVVGSQGVIGWGGLYIGMESAQIFRGACFGDSSEQAEAIAVQSSLEQIPDDTEVILRTDSIVSDYLQTIIKMPDPAWQKMQTQQVVKKGLKTCVEIRKLIDSKRLNVDSRKVRRTNNGIHICHRMANRERLDFLAAHGLKIKQNHKGATVVATE